jgi:hypothetical protein
MDKVDKIYGFVEALENHYYDKLGDDFDKNILLTLQASAYQRVRYFIEELKQEELDGQ